MRCLWRHINDCCVTSHTSHNAWRRVVWKITSCCLDNTEYGKNYFVASQGTYFSIFRLLNLPAKMAPPSILLGGFQKELGSLRGVCRLLSRDKGLGRFGSVKAVASPEFGVNNTVRNYEFGVNNIGRLRLWCWPIKLKSTSYGAVTVTTCKCNLMSRSNHNMSYTIDALFRILATHINQFRSWTRIFF